MEKNLEHYVAHYKNFLGKEFCASVVDQLANAKFQLHAYADHKTLEEETHSNDLSVSYDKIEEYGLLSQLCWNALEQYHKNLSFEWYSGWAGYSLPRFNKYDVGTEMRIHCDHIHTMFDGTRKGIPTLTLLGCLNEDYKGGDLILFEDQKIDFKTGDILIFPSNFLYPHAVTPVTEGTRYSFVCWSW